MELTNINGTVFLKVSVSRLFRGRSSALGGCFVLRMMVLMLAMRLMILALTLASGPVPKAGSYDAGERLTARAGEGGKGVSHFGFYSICTLP